jgi:hypothetical protein
MKRMLVAIGLGVLLLLAGCSSDGTEAPYHGPITADGSEAIPNKNDVDSVKIDQPFVYADDLEVKVERVVQGTDTVRFDIRVTNNSAHGVEIASVANAVWGDTDAELVTTKEVDAVKILPGRSRTGSYTFAAPQAIEKGLFEFTPTFDHATAIFELP